MIGAKKNAVWSVVRGHCIVSNFRLNHGSHSQILTAMETPSAQTLDPTWFVCHLLIDRHDFSYLLHQHCRVTSLWIIQFPCISWIGIGENYALQSFTCLLPKGKSFTFGLHLLPTPRWHLLLLKLGFSTKLPLLCLHLTRSCGLCHHPPLSNSSNVSGYHLAGSNKTGCWSSFVSFVASFSSVRFCHSCHLSSCSRWLCPLI